MFCCLVISLCVLCCFSLYGKSPAVCVCVCVCVCVNKSEQCAFMTSWVQVHLLFKWVPDWTSLFSPEHEFEKPPKQNKTKKRSKTFISYQTSTSGGLPPPLAQPIGVHSSSLEAGDAKTSCETIRTIAWGEKKSLALKTTVSFPFNISHLPQFISCSDSMRTAQFGV